MIRLDLDDRTAQGRNSPGQEATSRVAGSAGSADPQPVQRPSLWVIYHAEGAGGAALAWEEPAPAVIDSYRRLGVVVLPYYSEPPSVPRLALHLSSAQLLELLAEKAKLADMLASSLQKMVHQKRMDVVWNQEIDNLAKLVRDISLALNAST